MITKTSEAFQFDTIDDVVSDIAKGKLVIVTDDAGKAYRTLLSAKGPLLGFALSADGATLHAGGPDDGLFAGDANGVAPTAI